MTLGDFQGKPCLLCGVIIEFKSNTNSSADGRIFVCKNCGGIVVPVSPGVMRNAKLADIQNHECGADITAMSRAITERLWG